MIESSMNKEKIISSFIYTSTSATEAIFSIAGGIHCKLNQIEGFITSQQYMLRYLSLTIGILYLREISGLNYNDWLYE